MPNQRNFAPGLGKTDAYGQQTAFSRVNYSLFSPTRKCGLALGGSIPAFLLAGSSYVSNQAAQDTEVLRAIIEGIALVPAMAFSMAFAVMFLYPLSDARFLQIIREIETRRQG